MKDRILFASCNSQHYNHTMWPVMESRQAAALVWAGDAVYGDDFQRTGRFTKESKMATPEILHDLYQTLLKDPGYTSLRKNLTTVIGTIDDHDYGINNGDRDYPYRKEAGIAFVDFLQHENHVDLSLMRQRAAAGKGIYGVKVFDFAADRVLTDREAGIDPESGVESSRLSDQSVAVFTLDVRSNKTPWKKDYRKHIRDYEADFLGKEQWEWLEEALSRSTATVNIIVNGLQVHADRFYDGNLVENWSEFPRAQHRLYQAIFDSGVSSPILVSGDVHMSEMMRKDCQKLGAPEDARRMLLEVTTSGLTHSWGTHTCARPNTGKACNNVYIQKSLGVGMHVAHVNRMWKDLLDMEPAEEGAKAGLQYSLELNFAEFDFDWESRAVQIRILGEDSKLLMSNRWDFDLLSGVRAPEPSGGLQSSHFDDLYRKFSSHELGTPFDYYCMPYRGPQSPAETIFGVISAITVAGCLLILPMVLPLVVYRMATRRKVKSV